MRFDIKSKEVWLLLSVSLMAFGANLPEGLLGNVIDRKLLLVALVVTVFISLFRYLKLMLFHTVSVLAIGANLPDQLASQLGISRPAMIVASGVLVAMALMYKAYYRRQDEQEEAAAELHEAAPQDAGEQAPNHLRDTPESRFAIL